MRKFLGLFALLLSCCYVAENPPTQQTVTNSATATAECSGDGANDRWPRTIYRMALAQSPSATPTYPATIAPPYDGDPLSATQLRTDDLTPLQNGVEAARLQLYGGGFKRLVACASNTVMTIQPMGAVVAKVGAEWQVVPHTTASTINPKTLAGGSFVASTRYYVYASLVANAVTWSVSTTGPDASRRYKTGDEQYLFVSTFYTDSTPDLLFYNQVDSEYVYESRAAVGSGVHGNLLLDQGALEAPTAVALTNAVPTASKSVLLQGYFATSAAANALQAGRIKGNSGTDYDCVTLVGRSTVPGSGQLRIAPLSSRNVYYNVQTNATDTMSIWVAGFTY